MDIDRYTKRYYKADLVSAFAISLVLFIAVVFGDYSRGVERLTRQITYLLFFLVPAKVTLHAYFIPRHTFSIHHNGKEILKRSRGAKYKLMRNSCGYLFFLALILTTNNNPLHLLNHAFVTVVFTTVTFGTVVHFIYLEKGDFLASSNTQEEGIPRKFYNLFVVYTIIFAFGVCFGNYLVLLDWYQVYAQFPITSYIGLSVGHLLASITANLLQLWD